MSMETIDATAKADAAEADPAETKPEPAPAKKASEPERTGLQSWAYAAAAVAYLIVPFLLGTALPAATATTALLTLLPFAALLLGLADGLAFRTTWAFPILTTILCFIGLRIYTNDGTWIYALGVLALTRVGTALGGRRRTKG
ncbi:hypothetical protein HMPREF2863_00970 [Micrococcus sp. HMSC067E09]|nr:hypothetical protein HMPREF2863_00970 [Micrococcus sp. HMSC067E09]